MKFQTFEEYIDHLEKEGYINEKGQPLKCLHCDSKNLEDYGHIYENLGCVEYQVRCKDCKKHVNTWSYGNWELP